VCSPKEKGKRNEGPIFSKNKAKYKEQAKIKKQEGHLEKVHVK
jgi:hypothetical protein